MLALVVIVMCVMLLTRECIRSAGHTGISVRLWPVVRTECPRNNQSGTATARVQNPHFDQLVSCRDFDDNYDESEYESGLASF